MVNAKWYSVVGVTGLAVVLIGNGLRPDGIADKKPAHFFSDARRLPDVRVDDASAIITSKTLKPNNAGSQDLQRAHIAGASPTNEQRRRNEDATAKLRAEEVRVATEASRRKQAEAQTQADAAEARLAEQRRIADAAAKRKSDELRVAQEAEASKQAAARHVADAAEMKSIAEEMRNASKTMAATGTQATLVSIQQPIQKQASSPNQGGQSSLVKPVDAQSATVALMPAVNRKAVASPVAPSIAAPSIMLPAEVAAARAAALSTAQHRAESERSLRCMASANPSAVGC
ncbi:MAG: hypothetical protein ABL901_06150 [Hyphomicrobiaceae bacterium]